MNYCSHFKGKKITVLGLGLLGRGVGDTKFLAECGAELIVTDLKTEKELESSLKELKAFPDIIYHLGEHQLEDFWNRDMILKAAGVPLNSPFIAEAKKHSIPVRMSADLLAEYANVKTVGVTGTRGKSTVAHMIAHTLRQVGRNTLLGGNIRGVSNLALLSQIRPDSILVLELDSWQLQGFGEAKISPNIAVFTNLLDDHKNYYPDEETYFNDKAHIYRYQKPGDVLIVGRAVLDMRLGKVKPPARIIIPKPIRDDWKLKIIGEHNKENAAFARSALHELGLKEEEIKNGLESFEPVEGRLQFVREINGIKIYNDNNATTPDATIAGIAALSQKGFAGRIILIIGGADKGLDPSNLVEFVKNKSLVSRVVLLKGTGTGKLQLSGIEAETMTVDTLKEAVDHAYAGAKEGDVILFSPAFASFGMFKNEYDRGDQFVDLVNNLA